MNIGIIVHSQSGYTDKVARLLKSAFSKKGNDVDIVRLRPVGKVAPRSTSFEIENSPSVEGYDIVIFGAPVWAFRASPVIMKCLMRLEGRLAGKKVLCFVTKGLPFRWTGGIQALGAMQKKIALSKGSSVSGEIIWRASMPTEARMQPVIDRMVAACTA